MIAVCVGALAQAAQVIFQVAEHEPGVVKVGLGLRAGLAQQLTSPLEILDFLGRGRRGSLLLGVADGGHLLLPISRKGEQQRDQRAHRASQDIQKRKQLNAASG